MPTSAEAQSSSSSAGLTPRERATRFCRRFGLRAAGELVLSLWQEAEALLPVAGQPPTRAVSP